MTAAKTSIPIFLLAAALASCYLPVDRDQVTERAEWLWGPRGHYRVEGGQARDGRAAEGAPPTQAAVEEAADLDHYLRYGLHHNAALRAAYESWRAALERIPQVSSLPDPQFTFAQFVEELQTRTGPQQRRYGLTQPIPWFGKLDLRGAVAAGAAEERWHGVRGLRLVVQRDIEVAFYEYAWLGQSIAIASEELELLRSLEPVVLRRIAGGSSGQQDLLRLQLEIGRVENELASRQGVRAAMSSRLESAMNWSGAGPLPLPTLVAPRLHGIDSSVLLRRAFADNPQLQRLQRTIGKNEDALELARLEQWPDLAVGVDYLETGDAASPVPGSGDDPWSLRLSMTLPIGRGRIDAARRQAEHELMAASHTVADRRATLRADLEHAAFQLEDAGRQVELYRETLLPRSREALELTRAAYTAGSASLLDLIDSERALLGFETAYWRACRDYHQSRARLEALVGGAL